MARTPVSACFYKRCPLVLGSLCFLVTHAFSAVAADDVEPFAVAKPPMSPDWSPGNRWGAETIDGKPVVRLTVKGVAYCAAKVVGEVPDKGAVMVRVSYHGTGISSFSIGIGAWGSPTIGISRGGDGWQTAEVAFPAARAKEHMKGGKIGMLMRGAGGKSGPAFQKIEIYKPGKEHMLSEFRKYVRKNTENAWKAAKSGKFTFAGKYDDKTPLKPSKDDEARGAIPFARPYLMVMYPASVPTAKERTLKLKARMTPGEYEPVQFGLKALKDLPDCSAEVVGKLPAGLEVDIRWLENVPMRTAGGTRSKKWHVQPNRFWTKDIFPTCSVKKGESQAWWAFLKSSDDMKPGQYTVKFALKSGGTTVLTYDLDLTILPFKLPKKLDYAWGMYTARAVDEDIVEDMARHGLNSLSAWPSFRAASGKKANFTKWDAYFKMLKKHGFDHSFAWYIGNNERGWSVYEGVGHDCFVEILKGINERVKDGRYPKNFCVTIDEAVNTGRSFGQLKKLFQMMQEHSPQVKRFGVSLNKHSKAIKHQGMIDTLSCNGSFAENSVWCKKNKYQMYTYGSTTGRTSAHSARYNVGFNPWRYDAHGTYGWALAWYNGDPYNDMDSWGSDWGIILPNWAGPPIATPCWEGWREGVDDRRYLTVYEDLVAKKKAPAALLDEIRKLLKEDQLSNEEKIGDSVFEALLNNQLKLKNARDKLIEGILKTMK